MFVGQNAAVVAKSRNLCIFLAFTGQTMGEFDVGDERTKDGVCVCVCCR